MSSPIVPHSQKKLFFEIIIFLLLGEIAHKIVWGNSGKQTTVMSYLKEQNRRFSLVTDRHRSSENDSSNKPLKNLSNIKLGVFGVGKCMTTDEQQNISFDVLSGISKGTVASLHYFRPVSLFIGGTILVRYATSWSRRAGSSHHSTHNRALSLTLTIQYGSWVAFCSSLYWHALVRPYYRTDKRITFSRQNTRCKETQLWI